MVILYYIYTLYIYYIYTLYIHILHIYSSDLLAIPALLEFATAVK